MEFRPVKLGRYVLYERLASGGMAEVYRATSGGAGGFQKQLAIKRILPNYANNEEFRRMFETEARICSSLTHANIVQVYDFQKNGEVLLLAMEFVNGKNLRQFINKVKKVNIAIPLELSVYIVNEVCKGLDYAHSKKDDLTGKPQNIIHRDMSPQNVMLSYEGAVKIVDFGIAKAKDRVDETRAGVIKGKFGYMSPEQANGETQNVDHRTDIFSTGIILWELVTGRRLFSAENDLATLKLIQECAIVKPSKINPKVPPELEKIVMKALTKDLSLRYQTAGNFHRQLQEFLYKHYSSFSQKDAAEILHKSFSAEIQQEKRRAEQFHNQSIPFSQGNQPAKALDLEDVEQALEGSITKSEQGAQTAVTSEEEMLREPDLENLVSNSNDRTVNADMVGTPDSLPELQDDPPSQKTVVSNNEDPFDRMPSLAEARDLSIQKRENTSSGSKRIPATGEASLATVAREESQKEIEKRASKNEKTSATTSIKLDQSSLPELERRRDRSISIANNYAKQNPESLITRNQSESSPEPKSNDEEVQLEVFKVPVRRQPIRQNVPIEEDEVFKPRKFQSRMLTLIILVALLVTGYSYKFLLNGDVWKFIPGKDIRNTAGENKPNPEDPGNSGSDPIDATIKGGCQMRVDTDPPVPGGLYSIDNQNQKEFTSGTLSLDLPCGKTVNLKVEVPGFKTAVEKISATARSGQSQRITLTPERIGTVIVTVDHPAHVTVDGVPSGEMEAGTPREFNLTVTNRPHRFRFTNGLLDLDQEREVTAVENVKSSVIIRLDEQKNKQKSKN